MMGHILYNAWVGTAAITAWLLLDLARVFFQVSKGKDGHRDKTWLLMGVVFVVLFLWAARTAIFLGIGYPQRVTNAFSITTGAALQLMLFISLLMLRGRFLFSKKPKTGIKSEDPTKN